MSKEKIELSSVVGTSGGLFSTSIGGELVIFDQERGKYYGAGVVGDKIWAMMSDATKVEKICEKLLEDFEVDRSDCERQVLDFLNDLHERGLIETQ